MAQFMQVKCKFQLTSETESSESLHYSYNEERVRLCTSVELDRNSVLILMICSNDTSNNHIVAYYVEKRARPRIIVKQIFYHPYNEDIVAICLSETGNKFVLVSASATIYILPIKNILLNLHAKQLRSSQGKSMQFYDASIINCCKLEEPMAVAYWESPETESQSVVIVANSKGQISFIKVDGCREISRTQVNEAIENLQIIKDRFNYALLISCANFKQFRFIIESIKPTQETCIDSSQSSVKQQSQFDDDNYVYIDRDITPSWDRKPIPVKLQTNNLTDTGRKASAVIHRVLVPSSRLGSHTDRLTSLHQRERSVQSIFYLAGNIIAVVDVLGGQNGNARVPVPEPRLLRFFASNRFYYKSHKPLLTCKLDSLYPDELITHVVLTDRFLSVATDHERCLIYSKNCCNLLNSDTFDNISPLVKEINFNSEEKILHLLKSPLTNDQDSIIDSFLLVTNRSIYSVEARQTCRDMFINLIDSHLGIRSHRSKQQTSTNEEGSRGQRKFSDTNITISNFLGQRDEVYEKINQESRDFSAIFKIELNSLYEAYGDRLMLRGQFELANKFFQLAKFDNVRILGKYIRLRAFKEIPKHLPQISPQEIIKALTSDGSLCPQQASAQSMKYSHTALSLLELFRQLCQQKQKQTSDDLSPSLANIFTRPQRKSIEKIFIVFLNACLDDALDDDSSRLWFNYINFYLNFVGNFEDLEKDILNILDSDISDYHFAVTLYKAIEKDKSFFSDQITSTPLETMKKIYNLSELFGNEFLVKLLDKTLDKIHGLM